MPKHLEAIQDTLHTFTRPVVLEVLRDVMHWTGIPAETRVLFPGETEQAYQPGSTVDNQAVFNQFEAQRMVSIKINEDIIEEQTLSISALNKDHAEIFYDPQSRVYVRPVYSPCDYTIEITYRAHDASSANRWRDEIVARVATYRDLQIHQPKYHYVFPDVFMRLLKHIHELRETGAIPYNQAFSEYVQSCMTTRASVLTMGDGDEGRWGVRESQTRVLGWFDFSGVPDKPDRKGEISAHTITISYKFKIDRPVACVIEYPLIINNELIDEHFRQTFNTYTIPEVASFAAKSNTAMGMFEAGERVRYGTLRDYGVKIPSFLEFKPRQVSPQTRPMITCLSVIDLENPTKLFSIDQLGPDWELDPLFIEFLRDESPWLNSFGKSIVNVTVYRNDDIINPSRVKIDSSLMVELLDEPDPRDIYHVRISYIFDWSFLTKEALDRLRYYPDILRMFIDLMHPNLWEHLNHIGGLGNIPIAGRNTTPSGRKPQGTDRYYYYPNTGWTGGVKKDFTFKDKKPYGNNDHTTGTTSGSDYDKTLGRDYYDNFIRYVVPNKPTRPLPWDGGDTPAKSSSNGIVPKRVFDTLGRFVVEKTNPKLFSLGWKNTIGAMRLMGFFVKTMK